MKLLIITQKVDRNDPVLGFFHRWITEFSKYCEKLTIICLQKGDLDLSSNIKVLSLGKENGESRLKYVLNFYKYIKEEKNNYDAVFVHMNQEYVLLGAVPWKSWNKKIILWRNHPRGNFFTDIAVYLSDKVFCTSPFSYTANFKKTEIMPVGIDTDFFKNISDGQKKKNSILFLGRISPIKRTDLFIKILKNLKEEKVVFSATIVGDYLPRDKEYFENIKKDISKYGLEDYIKIESAVSNDETLKKYNKYAIYMNLTPSGSFDKTIFEAMSSESLILVSNKGLRGKIEDDFICKENDIKDSAEKLKNLLNLSEDKVKSYGKELRELVIKEHSLKKLGEVLFKN